MLAVIVLGTRLPQQEPIGQLEEPKVNWDG